jgi:hypothetical protein
MHTLTAAPLTITFGKHAGIPITRVPPDFLVWLASKSEFVMDGIEWVAIAEAELKRRGTRREGILPSHHAIDRFSQRHLDKFLQRENPDEGLSSFVGRLATTAWELGEVINYEEIGDMMTVVKALGNMGFVFACTSEPRPLTVKTVLVLE